MGELAGKAALVTGGSRGIGAAIAQSLAERGAAVAITYAQAERQARTVAGAIAAAGGRAQAIQADSADPAAVRQAVEQSVNGFGRLDILVNNAGIFPFGPPEDVSLEELDRTLAIHVRATFVAAQVVLRHMGAGGRIVSIGSCLAHRVPAAGFTLYAMSKSALVGFTKGLARDVGARGITVNLVDPGPTATDMNPAEGPGADGERALTALGRYARPAEIATMVAHLAGEGGRFVTGAALAVDGGYAA